MPLGDTSLDLKRLFAVLGNTRYKSCNILTDRVLLNQSDDSCASRSAAILFADKAKILLNASPKLLLW